ncbi:DUF3945 domain-containing protein [Fibrella sp. HMF5335]|uniref:DUF3945 domain-containing protein n=1 Tax=Fibrella rubiginis TaxID=2817060 RepID=A0A939GH91_9BACT|nr:DUF3945 domain-containing protein [Fibrella rubiginis]MBO0936423.1 DUF3945 domain-containing protein [Fibrella rubiginis]
MTKSQVIAEQVETEHYSLQLPAKSEKLRQYLENDGLLSNEEITSALYDDALTKKALREKVAAAGVTTDKRLIDQLTNHLWDTHQSVKAAKQLLPSEGIDPKATYRLTIQEGQEHRLQALEQRAQDVPMPKVVVVSGNLLANFLHNYRLNRDMQLTIDKVVGPSQGVQAAAIHKVHQSPDIAGGQKRTEVNSVRRTEQPVDGRTAIQGNQSKVKQEPQPVESTSKSQGEVASAKNYAWEQVASQLAAAGITREQLVGLGQLSTLLSGKQTGPVSFEQKIDNRYVSLTGKLRVAEVNGQLKLRFQPIQDEKALRAITIPKQVQGYVITPNDRATLIKTGEMGNVVELTNLQTNQTYRAYIGTDPKTQQLVVTRQEQVKLPKSINGVTLTQTQREMIGQGKAIRLDGLKGENGQTFSAYVQVSAAKGALNVINVPDNAVKKTTDLKTAQDLRRPSHKLDGTTSGQSAKTERAPVRHVAQEGTLRDDAKQGPRLR